MFRGIGCLLFKSENTLALVKTNLEPIEKAPSTEKIKPDAQLVRERNLASEPFSPYLYVEFM